MYRKTLNFMVMENIFYTGGPSASVVKPHSVYDIKGSWVDRNASGTRAHKPESGTFKDQVGFPLFFCDFQSENAEIAPFVVHFYSEMKGKPAQDLNDMLYLPTAYR